MSNANPSTLHVDDTDMTVTRVKNDRGERLNTVDNTKSRSVIPSVLARRQTLAQTGPHY
jgi:hypothetical protein